MPFLRDGGGLALGPGQQLFAGALAQDDASSRKKTLSGMNAMKVVAEP